MQRMLTLTKTPGVSRDDLAVTHPQDKQGSPYRNANRLFHGVCPPTDVVWAQPQPRCAFPVHQLTGETERTGDKHLAHTPINIW